jgi:uncharacterized protein (DUF934 family)
MSHLINRTGALPDSWVLFDGDAAKLPEGADVLIPFDEWHERAQAWLARPGRIGLLLAPTDDPKRLSSDDLQALSLIAISFAKFTDGRAYSIARILRERLGWQGELSAVGDVLRDQLFLMARCGFTSFALRADQNPLEALKSFRSFSVRYQACTEEPSPLFRRRRQLLAA